MGRRGDDEKRGIKHKRKWNEGREEDERIEVEREEKVEWEKER